VVLVDFRSNFQAAIVAVCCSSAEFLPCIDAFNNHCELQVPKRREIVQSLVNPPDPHIAPQQFVPRFFAVVGIFGSVVSADLALIVAPGGESAPFDWLGHDNPGIRGQQDSPEVRSG
jgi:hypothetical protein